MTEKITTNTNIEQNKMLCRTTIFQKVVIVLEVVEKENKIIILEQYLCKINFHSQFSKDGLPAYTLFCTIYHTTMLIAIVNCCKTALD